ncbi:pyridoxal phosphate-dependent transferase [Lactarius psammicola]|nr:pyridoxal phosphate-dependent transferase [Lactarius psammicola]
MDTVSPDAAPFTFRLSSHETRSSNLPCNLIALNRLWCRGRVASFPVVPPMSSTSHNTSAIAPGSDKEESRPSAVLLVTQGQPPVAVSGKGIYITLDDGREIDAAGGVAVACIGNGHPVVREAVKEQVDKLAYVYNMQLSNEPAEELASILLESGKGAFELCGFIAGGSEAMESAMKLARQYWYEQNQPQRRHFISRHMSYHGNTVTALSLSGHSSWRAPYEEILQHENIHKVSPAYAKRFQRAGETEGQYVERLRQELEDKFPSSARYRHRV